MQRRSGGGGGGRGWGGDLQRTVGGSGGILYRPSGESDWGVVKINRRKNSKEDNKKLKRWRK